FFEVLRDRDADPVAVLFSPPQEGPRPVPPPGPAAPDREPERLGPLEEPERLAIRFGLHLPASRLRFHEEPARERPLERNAGAARVQIRPAPVVVRVPGVRGQDEDDRRRIVGTWANHEARVGALAA